MQRNNRNGSGGGDKKPSGVNKKKTDQDKQKEQRAQAERSKQSKADRSVNAAVRYGDAGRDEGFREKARESGQSGKLIAHSSGGDGSGTSNKFQTFSKNAVATKNSGKPSSKESEEPSSGRFGPRKQKEEKAPFPKQDLAAITSFAKGQKTYDDFVRVYKYEFQRRPALSGYSAKMDAWADKAAEDQFAGVIPASIAGGAVQNVLGDGMDCLIRALLLSALGHVDEAAVGILRDHLVQQGVAHHGQMLDLARTAGSILVTYMVAQGILGAAQGIVVYVPDGRGGVAPQITVLGGANPIRLWLSDEHFRAVR
jgi:hypothetical protein